jgi:hypothetical protein
MSIQIYERVNELEHDLMDYKEMVVKCKGTIIGLLHPIKASDDEIRARGLLQEIEELENRVSNGES